MWFTFDFDGWHVFFAGVIVGCIIGVGLGLAL